jgi:hypothetical protein
MMTVREYIHSLFPDQSLGRIVEAKTAGINLNLRLKELSARDSHVLSYILIANTPLVSLIYTNFTEA